MFRFIPSPPGKITVLLATAPLEVDGRFVEFCICPSFREAQLVSMAMQKHVGEPIQIRPPPPGYRWTYEPGFLAAPLRDTDSYEDRVKDGWYKIIDAECREICICPKSRVITIVKALEGLTEEELDGLSEPQEPRP
jgi:hypothetical protein